MKMEELLIWINEKNEIIGYGKKQDTHIHGQLHRAFSVFIYDPEKKAMLIQKRAKGKYHSGGLWSNACCSHPRKEETWAAALSRCLKEELGVDVRLRQIKSETPEGVAADKKDECFVYAGDFQYYSSYGELAEHELDSVFVYRRTFTEQDISCNPNEAEEILWIHPDELESWLANDPEQFTSWFAPAYEIAKTKIQDKKEG